jgi:outer membrane protein OmpA-like peptidoglycan-associated protein
MTQQLAKGASKMGNGSGVGDAGVPGRQSIEDALANIGQVPTRESPVAIPGNALFGHDSSELGPESIPMLEKIADLRRRFPDYIMGIIGHTDSTGSPDYNMRLSQRRADAVKEWLVRRYNMNPAKLETMGRGSQELLVSGGNVEDQAPNRRVEVLLRPSGPAQGSRPAKKGN